MKNKGLSLSISAFSTNDGDCEASMFNGDDATGGALLSCKAQTALQRNWFPDPIGGLFSYQVHTLGTTLVVWYSDAQ